MAQIIGDPRMRLAGMVRPLGRCASGTMKGFMPFLTAGLLAACSSIISDLNARQVSPEVQSQINVLPQKYRQMAADTLPGVLKGVSLAGAEISELSLSIGSQFGDSKACVKINISGKTEYFAVFYMDGKYFTERRAVMIDNCKAGVYSPLPSKSSIGISAEHR
jgi:hypothetical protein